MLPIGTYGNRKKYGANNHITPEGAVKIGIDLNTKITIGMNWGTIELADEPPWEPPVRFRNAATQKQIVPQRIWLMKIGETRLLPNSGYKVEREAADTTCISHRANFPSFQINTCFSGF